MKNTYLPSPVNIPSNRYATVLMLMFTAILSSAQLPDDTRVYWEGGKRGHIEGCRRLTKDPDELAKMKTSTMSEMKAAGAELCSRCPGSTTPGKGNPPEKNKPSGKPLQAEDDSETAATQYDPNMTVCLEGLWLRVHAPDCDRIIAKDLMKTMTLEEADKAGYRIGEATFSIRRKAYCCLKGHKRKHPELKIADDAIFAGDDRKDRFKHLIGCHRYFPESSHIRRTQKEWSEEGFPICPHCIHRGPSAAVVTDEEWAKLTNRRGIQEVTYTDPLATLEHFKENRFFFPVGEWLGYYQAYRATGAKSELDNLLYSARHYNELAKKYPSVAQHKAQTPEGIPFMYSMAASARITLQLARKYPNSVSPKDIDEAEEFLKTMLSVLKPICEGDDDLDPKMGIPKKLANDFTSRAYNRALNGIGTLSMMSAALTDLQALKKTTEYQPRIDRYRKVIEEYLKNFKDKGFFCTKIPGETLFTYAYPANDKTRMVDGDKVFGRAEDAGHYSHSLQGLMCIYEATPELGVDDDFMTAMANARHYTTSVKNGAIVHPTQQRVNPGKYKFTGVHERFYMLEAFRDGIASSITPHIEYMKALRKDRSVIHLGEKKP